MRLSPTGRELALAGSPYSHPPRRRHFFAVALRQLAQPLCVGLNNPPKSSFA